MIVRPKIKAKGGPGRELYCMGKFPIALLIIVSELVAVSSLQADEHVRRLQEELRKRHLFYGNADGEYSPALVTALSRYQAKKGFPVTGRLDSETSSSLGISHPAPRVAPTPFVVAKGDVRGMNGESLPSSTPLFVLPSPQISMVSEMPPQPLTNLTAANTDSPDIRLPGESRRKKVRAVREARPTGSSTAPNPFVIAYRSLDHAVDLVLHDTKPRKKRPLKKRT